MADVVRDKVLWVGAPPTPGVERELACRELSPALYMGTLTSVDLGAARAAVFSFDNGNITTVASVAREHLMRMLDYGLRVNMVASSDKVQGDVQAELTGVLSRVGSRANPRTTPQDHEIAERIARYDAGPAPRTSLKITMVGKREPIRDRDRPLFERAFHNCREIALTQLSGGRSAARVFSAHATVDNSVAGSWPQPYFVKLDSADKIETEKQKYQVYGPFVPFGLRPGLVGTVVGAERALLVGDFVDRSESLWDVARRNMSSRAVASLLDVTLGGFRKQGYARDPKERSIADALQEAGVWKPEWFKRGYEEHAESEGVRVTPEELGSTLRGLRQRYREAPMHGDLHAENVRVQDDRAILIDLASVASGPLSADLAALETWLAFEVPPDAPSDEYEDQEWRAVIDHLYAPDAFRHLPQPSEATSQLCWLSTCLLQIRAFGKAIQTCPNEYQSAVAVNLLRRCQWAADSEADRFRRAHGYLVAARLTADLKAQEEAA